MIKKTLSMALSMAVGLGTLTSCTQQGSIDMPFVEDELKQSYTAVAEGSALTLYVDGSVSESGDGTEAAPFKTIADAQAAVRALKSGEGLPVGGVTVLVKDGEYYLTETLSFTAEDSGTAESPITYVSESKSGAVLTGGLILSAEDFEPLSEAEKARIIDPFAKENTVKVDLKTYGLTYADWGELYPKTAFASQYDDVEGDSPSELFIDGVRAVTARWPNEDFLTVKDVVDYGDFYLTNFPQEYQNRRDDQIRNPELGALQNPKGATFTVENEIIEHMKHWQTIDGVLTRGYFRWGWYDEAPSIEAVDYEKGTITHAQAIYDSISINGRFFFDNVFEELDTEGEFYIDRQNGILYVYKTDNFDRAQIILSTSISDLVQISDSSYLTLKGFKLCATRGNGVTANGNNITVDNCNISNIRGYGIVLNGKGNRVQNCEIASVGGYGVSVSGGDEENLISSESYVYNNYIHDFGQVLRTYNGAVHFSGCGVTVSHNEIANAPHMAVGGSGPNHVFEYNEVYNVCTETSDCGAVYCGLNYNSYGTVFRYNYFHDIGNSSGDSHGIYWDDGLSGQTAYGNVMINIKGHSFMIGGGRDNIVENNIIINSTMNVHCDTRVRDGILYDGWFDINATIKMSDQIRAFKQNEAWLAAFPTFATVIPYSPDYTGDMNDPNYMINPANNKVQNNFIYFLDEKCPMLAEDLFTMDISDEAFLFIEPVNNYFMQNVFKDFPHWHNGDYTLGKNSKAKELCPEFEIIPFTEIGRID